MMYKPTDPAMYGWRVRSFLQEVRRRRERLRHGVGVVAHREQGVAERGDRARRAEGDHRQEHQEQPRADRTLAAQFDRFLAARPPCGKGHGGEQEERVHQVQDHPDGAGDGRVVGDIPFLTSTAPMKPSNPVNRSDATNAPLTGWFFCRQKTPKPSTTSARTNSRPDRTRAGACTR
jgi:hypothetical protein